MVPFIQSAFTTGEIAPALFGHVDLVKFHVAAATARNCFVNFHGGLYSRAGTAYCLLSKQSYAGTGPPRLINFQFNIKQGFCLEFGDRYIRFYSNGAPIVEPGIAITAAAQTTALSFTIPGHDFVVGDWIAVSGATGMTEIDGEVFIVSVVAGSGVGVTDLNGAAVNSTTFPAYTGGGIASRIYTLATPYAAADLPKLKFTQSADTMTLVHPNYPPAELTRITDNEWLLTVDTFGSSIAAPASITVGPTTFPNPALSPPTLAAGYAYVVTAIDAVTGEESVASPIGTSVTGVDMAQTAGSYVIGWAPVTNQGHYNIYRAPTSYNTGGNDYVAQPPPVGSIFSYIGTAYGTSFVDSNITSAATKTPPLHLDPFAPGQILDVNITVGGSGNPTLTVAIITSTGSGAVILPVINGGVLVDHIIQNPGKNYAPGDTILFGGPGAYATGTITFATNPAANNTVTINTYVFTFVASVTAAQQVLIGSTLAKTISNLVAALATCGISNVTAANFTGNATQLVITFATPGTAGNGFLIAASNATASGAHLTGGGTGNFPTATLDIGPQTGTYPSVVCYFQQRRVYLGSLNNPETYWMSQPGAYLNFDSSLPVAENDAITGSPWSQQVNGISFAIQMPAGLIVFAGLGIWVVNGTGGSTINPQPITPSSQQALQAGFSGCSDICPPFTQNYDLVYVTAKGYAVRDIFTGSYFNIFQSNDLTELSSHLFYGYTLQQVAWTEDPYKVAWYVRSDGILISLTFVKEQEVYGWARHDTYGQWVSVASVIEPVNGVEIDALYSAVARPIGTSGSTVYTIERSNDRIWFDIEDAWCVDCAVALPQPTPQATLTASDISGDVVFVAGSGVFSAGDVGSVIRVGGGIATVTKYIGPTTVDGTWNLSPAQQYANTTTPQMIPQPAGSWSLTEPVTVATGLAHLAGQLVTGTADGIPLPLMVVSATGTVTLPFAASNVIIGLPFQVQAQSVYLDTGTQPTIQGRRKDILAVTTRVDASLGFKIGANETDGSTVSPPVIAPVWTNLQAAPNLGRTYTSPGGQTVQTLFTGDIRVNIDPNWAKPGQVAIQQDQALPLSLTALIPETLEGDLPESTYSQKGDAGKREQGQLPRGPGTWMLRA